MSNVDDTTSGAMKNSSKYSYFFISRAICVLRNLQIRVTGIIKLKKTEYQE